LPIEHRVAAEPDVGFRRAVRQAREHVDPLTVDLAAADGPRRAQPRVKVRPQLVLHTVPELPVAQRDVVLPLHLAVHSESRPQRDHVDVALAVDSRPVRVAAVDEDLDLVVVVQHRRERLLDRLARPPHKELGVSGLRRPVLQVSLA